MTKLLSITQKSMTMLLVLALAFSTSIAFALRANAQEATATVTIVKYVDGALATAASADNAVFTMYEEWDTTNVGSGNMNFNLEASSNPAYQDATAAMSIGSDYNVSEVMNSTVGTSCSAGTPFALTGYSYGDTLALAAAATPTTTAPSFTDLTSDKYVIVWNETCEDEEEEYPYVKVTIKKYVDGAMATAESADNTDFRISANWNATNIGSGSGQFSLDENGSGGSPIPYHAVTAYMDSGADYSLSEVMDSNVGENCDAGTPFALTGYTTGDTLAEAQAGTPSTTTPNFVDFTHEKYVIVWNDDCSTPEPSEDAMVTIVKYIDSAPATTATADSLNFTMNETWDADNIGSGNANFDLVASSNPAYQDVTAVMNGDVDYSVNEVMNSNVGVSCEAGTPFALVGYTTGDTLALAAAATPTTTAPSFTDLTSDKYVIVWNETCEDDNDEDVEVTIVKYIDGHLATDTSASNSDFQMFASWDASNIGSGSGQYTLSGDNQTPFHAVTVEMSDGADYATNEIMDSNTGVNCDAGTPFALVGYTTGDTLALAAAATPTTTAPSFTDLTSDKYVIVWNEDCDDDDGTIGGEVGVCPGTLDVTSVETLDGTATADGTFDNGWEYAFNITVPCDEDDLAMRFADWARTGGGGTIPAGSNMRISSLQANNSGATVLVTAANTYTTPDLHMTGDLNSTLAGLQVRVIVEVAIPTGTPSGSYTTTYGVRTQ